MNDKNIKKIMDIIKRENDDKKGLTCFGLRKCCDDAQVNDYLAFSYDWDMENDCQSDELLNGTCTIGISNFCYDEDNFAKEIKKAYTNVSIYPGDCVFLVGGIYEEIGNDCGEKIINNNFCYEESGAKVLLILD